MTDLEFYKGLYVQSEDFWKEELYARTYFHPWAEIINKMIWDAYYKQNTEKGQVH